MQVCFIRQLEVAQSLAHVLDLRLEGFIRALCLFGPGAVDAAFAR